MNAKTGRLPRIFRIVDHEDGKIRGEVGKFGEKKEKSYLLRPDTRYTELGRPLLFLLRTEKKREEIRVIN